MSIPIAQIPNAPKTGLTQLSQFRGGATPFNPSAGPQADLGMAASALGNVDSLLQQPGQDSDAFGGATAEALARFGDSGVRAAAVMADWNLSMTRANDEGNLARADRLVTEARAAHEVEASRLPPDQHLSSWNEKYLPKLEKQLEEIPLSSAGRARFSAWWEPTKAKVGADIWTSSNKAVIDNGRLELSNAHSRAMLEGRYEDAAGIEARGVGAMLFSPEEAGAMAVKREHSMKWSTVEQALMQDSEFKIYEDVRQAVETGTESKLLPNFSPMERQRVLEQARQIRRVRQAETHQDGLEKVLTAQFRDEDEIQATYQGKLAQEDINSLKSAFQQTPDQIERRLSFAPAIQTMINAYDPTDDPDGTKASHVRRYIHALPSGHQQQYSEQLTQKIRDNKPEPPVAAKMIREQMKKEFEAGKFGAFKVDKDTGLPKDPAAYSAALESFSREATAFENWIKRNKDATDTEVIAEANRIRTESIMQDVADGKKPARSAGFVPPSPEAIQRDLDRRRQERERQRATQPPDQSNAAPGGIQGRYVEGNIGPTSTGPHFDIKRADRGRWDRDALDQYVRVDGNPLSSGRTVGGGVYGAPRSYGTHRGWDFAFGGGTVLTLTNGAVWLDSRPTRHGDKARFQTPDGHIYEILHGQFEQEDA